MANVQCRFENASFLLQDFVSLDISPQKISIQIRILTRELTLCSYINNLLCAVHNDAYKSSYIFFLIATCSFIKRPLLNYEWYYILWSPTKDRLVWLTLYWWLIAKNGVEVGTRFFLGFKRQSPRWSLKMSKVNVENNTGWALNVLFYEFPK